MGISIEMANSASDSLPLCRVCLRAKAVETTLLGVDSECPYARFFFSAHSNLLEELFHLEEFLHPTTIDRQLTLFDFAAAAEGYPIDRNRAPLFWSVQGEKRIYLEQMNLYKTKYTVNLFRNEERNSSVLKLVRSHCLIKIRLKEG